MNKIDFTLAELLNTPQAAKGIIKGHPSINNVEKLHFPSVFPRERASGKRRKFQVTPTRFLIHLGMLGKGKKVNDPKP